LVPQIINKGFNIVATLHTAKYIKKIGYPVRKVNKVMEGRPHIVDEMVNGNINLVINTTEGKQSINDSASIRQTALQNKIFCTTTMFGALAIVEALSSLESDWSYLSLQEINKK
jgi:carbamoyl-phosphate synthase large subunit